jgi:hypothetical protein
MVGVGSYDLTGRIINSSLASISKVKSLNITTFLFLDCPYRYRQNIPITQP